MLSRLERHHSFLPLFSPFALFTVPLLLVCSLPFLSVPYGIHYYPLYPFSVYSDIYLFYPSTFPIPVLTSRPHIPSYLYSSSRPVLTYILPHLPSFQPPVFFTSITPSLIPLSSLSPSFQSLIFSCPSSRSVSYSFLPFPLSHIPLITL